MIHFGKDKQLSVMKEEELDMQPEFLAGPDNSSFTTGFRPSLQHENINFAVNKITF